MGKPSRMPPPFYFVIAFALGAGLHAVAPFRLPPATWIRAAAWLLMAIAALLAVSAVLTLRRARTTVWYHRPASAFVTRGPYQYTRNPMYLSLVLLYTGLSLTYGLAWTLLTLPLAIWIVQVRFIRPEERYLRERFGEEFTRYAQRVRRWI